VIQQHGHIVTFMYIFAHSSILRRKRRGIYPKEIKIDKEEEIKDRLRQAYNIALVSA